MHKRPIFISSQNLLYGHLVTAQTGRKRKEPIKKLDPDIKKGSINTHNLKHIGSLSVVAMKIGS